MPSHANGTVGYILKGFPRLSETFIANEIHLLETMGMRLHLFSVKAGETEILHDVVSRISAPRTYLPDVPSVSGINLWVWLYRYFPKFSSAHWRLVKRRPGAYLTSLGMAISMAWKYRQGRFGQPKKAIIKEFLQAGYIALHVIEDRDIRHLHGHFCHGATTITWFASRLAGVSFSFTAHAKDIYEKNLNPGDLLERKLRAARFVATCTAANNSHLSRLCTRKNVVHTIYHGLDVSHFAPVLSHADSARPLVLSVGRFVSKKGFPCLVEACARLKASGYNFRCQIIGERGEQSGCVTRLIRDLNLDDVVSTKGPMSQEELKRIYAQTSVFALPCQIVDGGDRDGIPNVLVEAMAMGIPVVSTPISGIPELVKDRLNGLLVPERDDGALASAIGKLLDQPQLRLALGAAARESICASFDSSRTTRVLRNLFVDTMKADGVDVLQTVGAET